jgi:CRISPR-associated protein Cas1
MLTDTSPLRVMSLHALLYCERLFYLEEIEEIRVADEAVYAGRRLHEEIVPMDDESPERRSLELASETLGLMGKVDAVRKRDGKWIAYEHKRGRCMRGDKKQVLAWPSDRIQAIAYAALLAEAFGEPVTEARVRYHADNVTAIIHVDESAIADLKTAIARAQELQQTTQRPPITTNENLCTRCSLAPVCLPEEERIQSQDAHADDEHATANERIIPKLFPSRRQKQTLHVCVNKARVGRSGESIVVTSEDELKKETKKTSHRKI